MGLLFESLFKKVERTNHKIIYSLAEGNNREEFTAEVKALNAFFVPLVHEMKDHYDYGVAINEKDIPRLDEELKEGQLLLYALQITKLNLDAYNKYFETKDASISVYKDIMFQDDFDHPDGWIVATVKKIMDNKEIRRKFYSPIGYCSEKVSMDDYMWAEKYSRIQKLAKKSEIIDLEPEKYLEKWNKTFQD
ncbi:hypothetical protein [Listeria seeligeri]|uniref:hypothetical protein n=1 Tax=Listeria seeligeri TaxID=1640 RepID=UPI0016280E30|nr:hypothetical protein [Listeria seeligeri]MBC1817152.1 hypothetical protein [Listeria seeligeri]